MDDVNNSACRFAMIALIAFLLTACSAPAATTSRPINDHSAALQSATTVERIVDGDTVILRLEGRRERVRLIGMNTPESVDPRRPVECLGKEASKKASEILTPGLAVRTEADPNQDVRDRNGRLLLYLWTPDGVLFNEQMIRLGYATEYTFAAPYRFQAEFRAAEREAKAAKRGLWADNACVGQFPPRGVSGVPSVPGRGAAANGTRATPAAP